MENKGKFFIIFKDLEGYGSDEGFVNKRHNFECTANGKINADCEYFDSLEKAMEVRDELLDLSLPLIMTIEEVK